MSLGTRTVTRPQNVKKDALTSAEEMRDISVGRQHIESLQARTDNTEPIEIANGSAAKEHKTLTPSQGRWHGAEFSILPPVVSTLPSPTLHPAQEWEGCVVEIGDDEFEARLIDVTAGDTFAREVAAIPLEEVSAEDRARMRVGSLFRWVIGYERSVGGTRSRVSRIMFIEPPRLTQRDIDKGREWAAWVLEGLRVE